MRRPFSLCEKVFFCFHHGLRTPAYMQMSCLKMDGALDVTAILLLIIAKGMIAKRPAKTTQTLRPPMDRSYWKESCLRELLRHKFVQPINVWVKVDKRVDLSSSDYIALCPCHLCKNNSKGIGCLSSPFNGKCLRKTSTIRWPLRNWFSTGEHFQQKRCFYRNNTCAEENLDTVHDVPWNGRCEAHFLLWSRFYSWSSARP